MAARAPFVTSKPRNFTLRLISPLSITLAESAACGTTPACFSTRISMSSTGSLSREDSLTSAVSPLVSDMKPRFGRRRCSGICPPSKPTLWKPPERALWPLWPRPAVLPQPEPMPRPTRWRGCLEPGAGFKPFSFISAIDAHQVVDLVDHPAHFGSVVELHDVVDPLQAEATNRVAMALLAASEPFQQLHFDF